MKIYKLLILTILFAVTSCNSSELKKTYWKNGNLKSELHYTNEQLDGKCVWYHENGNPQYSVTYTKNQLSGEAIRWYESGVIQSRDWYKNNKLDSVSRSYSPHGVLVEQKYYSAGKLNGNITQWYDSGLIYAEGQYVDDMMDGIWLHFYDDGKIASRAEFDMGAGLQKGYSQGGFLNVIIPYKDNLKHGEAKYFDPIGKLVKSEFYEYGDFVNEVIY